MSKSRDLVLSGSNDARLSYAPEYVHGAKTHSDNARLCSKIDFVTLRLGTKLTSIELIVVAKMSVDFASQGS